MRKTLVVLIAVATLYTGSYLLCLTQVIAASPTQSLQQIPKLIAAGQCQKAVAELDRIIASQPDNALAHYYRGQALERLGSRSDAIAAYETASLLEPGAKFTKDCQLRMTALAKPAAQQYTSSSSALPSTKGVLKKGKQVTPFQLHSEQSRMMTEVSDRDRKELQAEVGRLQSLASNGPMPAAVSGNFNPAPRPPAPPDRSAKPPEQLALNIPAGNISETEKERLTKYDVIFIVDHSGSMGQKDCPQGSSRWSWLAAQVFSINRDARECFPRGLNVVMFDDNAEEFTKLKPEEFVKLFTTYGPAGGTNTGHAFRSQMQNVQARLLEHRPVMVVGITDGLPSNPLELQEAFQELKQMASHSSTPLKVSLLHIGSSTEGLQTLSQLVLLAKQGISTGKSFVQVYPFSDLNKFGLARTLIKILNE